MTAFPPALLQEIERAAVRGWPAVEQIPVDGWLFRRSGGGSIRANSVAALAYTGGNADASIAAVEALAAQRAMRACFTVSDVSVPSDLDQRLDARGYTRAEPHVTMAKRAAGTAQPPSDMEIGDKPSPGWMMAYLSGLAADRRGTAERLISGLPARARFFSALADGRAISCGVSIVDGRLASVQCMATLPAARRLGGARRVLAAIETVAAVRSAQFLYLQTSADNADARALYEHLGFAVIGRYHTRTAPRR